LGIESEADFDNIEITF